MDENVDDYCQQLYDVLDTCKDAMDLAYKVYARRPEGYEDYWTHVEGSWRSLPLVGKLQAEHIVHVCKELQTVIDRADEKKLYAKVVRKVNK